MTVPSATFLHLLQPTWLRMGVLATCVALAWGYLSYLTPEKRVVRARLSEADEKSKAAIDTRLRPLTQLFARARKGAKPFAQEALSWKGKWKLVQGIADSGKTHRQYLSELFAQHVLATEDLRRAMESAVAMYLDDVEGYEAELLVRLRADLANLQGHEDAATMTSRTDEAFRAEYQQLASQVVTELHLDIGVTVSRELGAMVAMDVVTQVALKAAQAAAAEMGVNAGVLSTGAASTVATLGVGLVVAVVLDYILDEVFKMAGYDPAAKIEALVVESIDKMEAALVRDTGMISFHKSGALRLQLQQLHDARSQVRRETIRRFLKEGGMR